MPKVIPISKLEDARNKVTSLDGDVTAYTDDQYPSALAVKKALDSLIESGVSSTRIKEILASIVEGDDK